MTEPIRRVGVIGAGVMGSGIAAHFANAGVEVILLDIVPPNLSPDAKSKRERNAFADGGLKKLLKAKPAQFYHKTNARLIRTGNLEDDLQALANVDLVIEAIVENLKIKQDLFTKLEQTIGDTTIVASNTSGLRIADMLEGRGESFKKRFLVMHFFNPVRYMKLLELVIGPDTDASVIDRIETCGREQLGKGIVYGKDTPNFVGNRIGAHSMMLTMHQMIEDGLTPEDVDAITGAPMGHPKSASFRTADMVGLDTFLHVANNCYDALTDDEEREVFKAPEFLTKMVKEKKFLGNKTKGGFYKKTSDGIFTIQFDSLEYRPKGGDADLKKAMKGIKGSAAERINKLIADKGKGGTFAWKVLSRSLAYSARRIGEIADSVSAVDNAMKWGYNWELGPFETWDALGFKETTERMKADGVNLPASVATMLEKGATGFYRDGQVWDLHKAEYVDEESDAREAPLVVVRKGDSAVLSNGSAEAWDLGDGVLGVTFKTKANSIDDGIVTMLSEAVAKAESEFRGLLLFNQGEHFCVGANLFGVVMASQQKQWDRLRDTIKALQDTTKTMKYSKVPVIAAPFGMTLGGGMELCFACDGVQAAAETYAGLVEPGVGLVPGGAGHVNMLWRALENIPDGTQIDTQPFVARVFENIATARVATSAVEAQHFGYFRHADGVSFDRARHLHEAKQRVIGLATSGYKPKAPRAYRLPGESGIATLGSVVDTLIAGGYASEHDGVIARKVAYVLCGGPGGNSREITEDELLELEREAFISLCGEPKSIARMQHMLMKNKPLRN